MTSEPGLQGRVAVVTGGSGGIGRAACLALARHGARVAVIGRDAVRVEETATAVRALSPDRPPHEAALALHGADVRDEAAVERAAGAVLERFGRIDILIAAAGIGRAAGAGLVPAPVVQLTAEAWDEVVDTNLKGVFLWNRAVLRDMLRRRSGQILNVSSAPASSAGQPFAAAYCASKFGLMGLTESLSEEVRGSGVRVMAILPDLVDTPMVRGTTLEARGTLSPGAVADLMVRMLLLPEDTVLTHPIVAAAPRGGRTGRGRSAPAPAAAGAAPPGPEEGGHE
jgi:3-oxoacyl-[acyl-carrier protein] reductase